jgi:addiction module HigA family antidote
MPKLKPISPGEILQDEFLTPLAISQNELARRTDMPPSRINEIVKGKRPVSAEAALHFASLDFLGPRRSFGSICSATMISN